MIPEVRDGGRGWRAAVAMVAFGATGLIIYALFSSGYGRIARPAEKAPLPLAVAPLETRLDGSPAEVRPASAALAVVSDDFWLTYLPAGLDRSGGGAIEPEPGVEGGWARFGTAGRFVEAQVEHGIVAADWQSYRSRVTVLDARDTTVRGRPAAVGRHPNGGRVIVWLERTGTGAWIRVSEPLSGELVAVAASVKAPVGD
ncbi:hypothetical protein ETD86_08765 [Nonomuraea turkmeniaca]|uniref:DUF4245 domain-containing protein n=1 Tax=Nonomuraea turkmeniaca TaxID=103838 RepID=A0A5S4FST7_9ACTN|nr:hypothetical protein [Nonomuraea turkmeniaca]TMR23191.1 hypothetical protein ETD86_08765 [Nonomuraea turkmeniaca]